MARAIQVTTLLALLAAPLGPSRADAPPSFEKDARPILKAHCFHCHGEGKELKGGLDLRLARFLLKGGESGPAVVAGDAAKSLLVRRVAAGEMPMGEKKLSAGEIEILAKWVAAGAKTLRPEPETLTSHGVTAEDRQWWAFRPVTRPDVPKVKNQDRVRTPVDAFILAKLEEKGLAFAPEADKRTLVVRAWFDLVGLPPPVEEVDLFLADDSADAYERLIERLLASSHYGERWGRHWLDAAGYADSDGFISADLPRAYAYKYRDYVIRSLNADKPWDQFIKEQLAGDEMIAGPLDNLDAATKEKLIATGYLRMAPDGTTLSTDVEIARNQVVTDTLKIVSTSLMGLSVGCAQCHDHRYDPIPQRDYYRLRAVFEPAYNPKAWRAPNERLISLYTPADREKARQVADEAGKAAADRAAKEKEFIAKALEKELLKFEPMLREKLRAAVAVADAQRSPDQKRIIAENPSVAINAGILYQYDDKAAEELKKLSAKIDEINARRPVEDFIAPLTEFGAPLPETRIFHRGDYRQPTDAVDPGDLTVVSTSDAGYSIVPKDPRRATTGRRSALARRLTDGSHPLTARVLVNRFWMHHFGQGIVGTPAEFGVMGDAPTHPELLDWLASEFVAQGWRLKDFHRLVMLSTAYRQSSQGAKEHREADPDRRLLSAAPTRRLDAEAIRDRILATSGVLNRSLFGPPVPVREDGVGQIVVGPDEPAEVAPAPVVTPRDDFRRSIYLQVRRSQPVALLRVFDAPVMETNCDRRPSSTVAPQALMLMNSDFVSRQACYFSARVAREAGPDAKARAERAWRLAYLRAPTAEELKDAVAFLEPKPDLPADKALTDLCHVLYSSNEFLYVD